MAVRCTLLLPLAMSAQRMLRPPLGLPSHVPRPLPDPQEWQGQRAVVWLQGRVCGHQRLPRTPQAREPVGLGALDFAPPPPWYETASGTAASRLLGMPRLRWCYQARLAAAATT